MYVCILCILVVPASAQETYNSVDYDEPTQSSSTILPAYFKLKQLGESTFKGNNDKDFSVPFVWSSERIVRILHRSHYSIILTHRRPGDSNNGYYPFTDQYGETYEYYNVNLYLIDHQYDPVAQTVKHITYLLPTPTAPSGYAVGATGLAGRDQTNRGDYCGLSDIAFSADGYLIGMNNIRCYHYLHLPEGNGITGGTVDTNKNTDNSTTNANLDTKPDGTALPKTRRYENGTLYFYKWNVPFDTFIANSKSKLTGTVEGTRYTTITAEDYAPTIFLKQTQITRENVRDERYKGETATQDEWDHAKHARFAWPSANFYRADVGYTMAVSGNLEGATASKPFWITFTTARVKTDSDPSKLRLVHVPVKTTTTNGEVKGTIVYGDIVASKKGVDGGDDTSNEFVIHDNLGKHYELDVSPFDSKSWVLDGDKCTPWTFKQYDGMKKSTGQNEWLSSGYYYYYLGIANWEVSAQAPAEVGTYGNSPNFFRYGKRNVMVYPYEENGQIKSLRLWDLSSGLKLAKPIELVGIDNISTVSTTGTFHYLSAFGEVDGNDLTVYLFADNWDDGSYKVKLYTYTTKGTTQGRGIFAYDLKSSFDKGINEYTFNFTANEYPHKAVLKLYDAADGKTLLNSHVLIDGGKAKSPYLSKVLAPGSEYTVKIQGRDLTNLAPGRKFTWAIEVTDTTIYNWEELEEYKYEGSPTCYRSFVTVDKSPESPHFGQVYQLNMWRNASNAADITEKNTLITYNPTLTTASQPIGKLNNGTNDILPMRLAVDSTGMLYIPDYRGNLYVADPDKLDQPSTYKKWNNTWSSSNPSRITSVATYGSGDNMDVIMYRNPSGNDTKLIDIYHHVSIGEDATPSYNTDKMTKISYSQDTYACYGLEIDGKNEGGTDNEANIIPTSKGYFVVNVSEKNQANPTGSPHHSAVMFYKKDGTLTYESWKSGDGGGWMDWLSHSRAGGAAVTNDENYFVVSTIYAGKSKIYVAQIDWGTNDANLTYDNKGAFLSNTEHYWHEHKYNFVAQMSFDYGNNLIMASDAGSGGYIGAYAVPKVPTTLQWLVSDDSPALVNTNTLIPADDSPYLNRTETPTRPIAEFVTEQCDDYDRVFDNGNNTNIWNDAKNWIPEALPHDNHRVRIDAPVTVDIRDAVAGYIDMNNAIEQGGKPGPTLTIASAGGLTVGGNGVNNPQGDATAAQNNLVEGNISRVPQDNDPAVSNPTIRTERNRNADNKTQTAHLAPEDIIIQANADGQGRLAVHNHSRWDEVAKQYVDISGNDKRLVTKATVKLYGKYVHNEQNKKLTWQCIGVPFAAAEAAKTPFMGSWMYQWNEPESRWDILSGWGHKLDLWRGYLLTQSENCTYTFADVLQSSQKVALSVQQTDFFTYTNDARAYQGANFFANSWTAPLQITNFEASDFEHCEPTIYLYAPTERKYIALPIGTAEYVVGDYIVDGNGKGIAQINPLQGFFVRAENANAKLTLDYARLVSTGTQNYVTDEQLATVARGGTVSSQPAPAHRAIAATDTIDETSILRIYVHGTDGTVDNVILIEGADYTTGYDRGSDGRKMAEDADIPYLTATSDDGDMAVSATPSIYGSFLNFKKGASREYTMLFDYRGAETDLVLQDLVTNTKVDIASGNSYTFTSTEEQIKTRFRISRREETQTMFEPSAYTENSHLYLQNPMNAQMNVAVYTVDGKLVQTFRTSDALTELSVPNMGVYLIQITTADKVITIKKLL